MRDGIDPLDGSEKFTLGGIELPVYADQKWAQEQGYLEGNATKPGCEPYTRGIHADMYRSKLWTMRQYAGFGSAKQTNERFKMLLEIGQKGLSVAFDLPTQLGLDSDDPLSEGEVGKVGVAIDTLADMRTLFDKINLADISTSMTINSPAIILLAMYVQVGEEQGIEMSELRGTIQNDILKEYIARGTYVFPPEPSMKLITDTFEYCSKNIPKWNSISISGYHIREAGSTAIQEVAFTISNALEYVDAAIKCGLNVDEFAPRLSFFFNCHNDFFEEISKFRAARQLWYELITERYKPSNPKSAKMRFHTQVAGVSLTAQQPLNNISRVTIQALAAICGGTQSLHTNSYDEALGLPTEKSATIALRTQQILAEESGVANVADPLAGSFLVEGLTKKIATEAKDLINQIETKGGALKAMELGFQQRAIHETAWKHITEVDSGHRKIIGVNHAKQDDEETFSTQPTDLIIEEQQKKSLAAIRSQRDQNICNEALEKIKSVMDTNGNLFDVIKHAVSVNCTLGEIMNTLKEKYGTYRAPSGF